MHSSFLANIKVNLKKKALFSVVLAGFGWALWSGQALADNLASTSKNIAMSTPSLIIEDAGMVDDISESVEINNFLNVPVEEKVISSSRRLITAYTSEVAQCDASPCITANGFNVCKHGIEDTIAANWLKFGTKVRIPELFGDRIFFVRDRMNARHKDRADIWFKDRSAAIKFGAKVAKIEVLE